MNYKSPAKKRGIFSCIERQGVVGYNSNAYYEEKGGGY